MIKEEGEIDRIRKASSTGIGDDGRNQDDILGGDINGYLRTGTQ